MKTVIYTRVSTDGQVSNGVSLENQETRCAAYCMAHAYENVEVIKDSGVSAKNIKRPGFQKLLSMVTNHEIDNVVVYSLSRFARSVKDTLTVLEMFNKNHINFHSITESIDTSSAVGRFFITTLSAITQYERELTSERTKSVLQHKKAKGLRVGSVPYGFSLDTDKKTLIKNEDEQQTIKMIVDLKDKSNKTYNEIVEELTKTKRKNKAGKTSWKRAVVVKLYRQYTKKDNSKK